METPTAANDHAALVIEYFPDDITSLCPRFKSYYSNAGLCHPFLHPFRCGVIICLHAVRFLYAAFGLDTAVHAGLPLNQVPTYISTLKDEGYNFVDASEFDRNSKHVTVLKSESTIDISPEVFKELQEKVKVLRTNFIS